MESTQDSKISQTIQQILNKMKQPQVSNIHPPFFSKTLSKFREEHYQLLKKQLKLYLHSEQVRKMEEHEKMRIVKTIQKFVSQFDDKYFPDFLEGLREPYIRKMFQENYGFDDVDFKVANEQFHLRGEIQNTLNQASEWLLQVQYTQDILSRIQLYFGVKTPVILEKLKKEGVQNARVGWIESFKSTFRSVASFALRKTSKVVQANFLTALAPAAAMVSFAVIGSSYNLPFKSDLNLSAFIPSLVVMIVPMMLDGMAECIDKNQMYAILEKWAINFQKMSTLVRKYNEFLQNAVKSCLSADTSLQFDIQYTKKYINELKKNLKAIEDESQEKIEQIRQRTEAYFRQYVQLKEGEWTVVLTQQQYNQTKTPQ